MMLESLTGWESKGGPRPGDQVLVLCCEIEFRTLQTTSRKVRVLLKWEYTLKRGVRNSEGACPELCKLWAFVFLEVETVSRLSSLSPSLDFFPLSSEWEEAAQSHLSCLLALACFKCWGLTLKVKTWIGLSKGQWRNSRVTGKRLSKKMRKNSRAASGGGVRAGVPYANYPAS